MKVLKTLVLVIAAIMLLGTSALIVACGNSNDGGGGGGGGHVSVPKSLNLVNGVITVNAGSYYNVPFTVNSSMSGPTVSGSFTASGGSGNDIIVLILDDIAYTNWVNGHQVTALYSSGQLTTDTFNVSMTTSGTYHLVYSNRFSVISTKNVSTTVDLKWSE